jgi:serine/threonine-protein kinase
MPLPAGARIGPYEITGALGAGGMGEVYRARDTRLNRPVAIKSLHSTVAGDPERIARFEREAQLLASLQHPNIAGIYGVETAGSHTYLALEFVEGRPLDALIKENGAMPVRDAVALARQIAEAIAAAHEKGIIHRDLKPGNVMVTADGHAKVLDFGLGKSLDDGRVGAGESAAANSPTMTIGATQAGIVLGTAGYMSPEQAKGRAADRRSDVWSFGCLLFELLTGSRAFEGEDVTDTIAAIVRGEPNWKALPPPTPPALRQLLERSLIKERTQRLPDMSVVRYILNEPGVLVGDGATTQVAAPAVSTTASRFWMAAALVFATATIGLAIAYGTRSPGASSTASARPPAHFTIVLPEGTELAYTNMAPLAIAPNGRMIVFPGRRAGRIQLFIHDVSTGETKALDGTDDARSPFFSPDGRWIGFFARAKLRKITVGGTSLQEITDAPDARGGSWSVDDIIYFAPLNTSGLWKVPAAGGTGTELTTPDPKASEISHRYPLALPDGKALLFMVWTGPGSDEHRIEHLSIADGRRQVVVQNADGPIAIVNGQLVYSGRQDALLTAPWSASRPSLQGVEPQALPFLAPIDNEGASAYAASPDGTFVRLIGGASRRLARITWIDTSGKTEPLPVPDRDFVGAAISPDGRRAAIHHRGGTEEIWIYDFATKSYTPLLTPGGSSQAPVWTVDSKYIVYRGTRQGFRNLFKKAADGSGAEERLTTSASVIHTPTSATPDGKWIVFLASGGEAKGGDILKVELGGAHQTVPVVATTVSENSGQVSPDSRWIAFETNVTGRMEIWVQPLAMGSVTGSMRQVSRDGGTGARWSPDGRELYFLTPDGIMAVTVSGDTFSTPRAVVQGRFRLPANANTNYDVARDGRFLHVVPIEPSRAQTRIEVVLNGAGR